VAATAVVPVKAVSEAVTATKTTPTMTPGPLAISFSLAARPAQPFMGEGRRPIVTLALSAFGHSLARLPGDAAQRLVVGLPATVLDLIIGSTPDPDQHLPGTMDQLSPSSPRP